MNIDIEALADDLAKSDLNQYFENEGITFEEAYETVDDTPTHYLKEKYADRLEAYKKMNLSYIKMFSI